MNFKHLHSFWRVAKAGGVAPARAVSAATKSGTPGARLRLQKAAQRRDWVAGNRVHAHRTPIPGWRVSLERSSSRGARTSARSAAS